MSMIGDMITAATSVTPRVQQAAAVATATPSPIAVTAATAATQAQQGAEQVQPQAAQAQAEVFNATVIEMPDQPTTNDVLNGLAKAIADPSINATTSKQLYQFHQEMLERQRAMISIYLERQS